MLPRTSSSLRFTSPMSEARSLMYSLSTSRRRASYRSSTLITALSVFSPCALGAVLDSGTIPRLGCRVVAGAANNQLAGPEHAGMLEERGILYAPDFVANSGGAIAALGIEVRGWARKQAEDRVVESVGRNLGEIFSMAEQRRLTTAAAAHLLAERRLGGG